MNGIIMLAVGRAVAGRTIYVHIHTQEGNWMDFLCGRNNKLSWCAAQRRRCRLLCEKQAREAKVSHRLLILLIRNLIIFGLSCATCCAMRWGVKTLIVQLTFVFVHSTGLRACKGAFTFMAWRARRYQNENSLWFWYFIQVSRNDKHSWGIGIIFSFFV